MSSTGWTRPVPESPCWVAWGRAIWWVGCVTVPVGLETTVKAGARAMADGKILDQTTVLGSKLVTLVESAISSHPNGSVAVMQVVKIPPQKKHLTFTNQGSALGPLPIFSRYPGYQCLWPPGWLMSADPSSFSRWRYMRLRKNATSERSRAEQWSRRRQRRRRRRRGSCPAGCTPSPPGFGNIEHSTKQGETCFGVF